MSAPGVTVGLEVNGRTFDWSNRYSELLSPEQEVVVENYLRFALKFWEHKRLVRIDAVIPSTSFTEGQKTSKRKKLKKPIGQSLEDTATGMRENGPFLANWLESDSGKHRKIQAKSALQRSFEKNVHCDTANLNPLTPRKRTDWARNRSETMLWLIDSRVGLAYALLVLYSFSNNDLEDFTFEEILFVIEYTVDNKDSLSCEALETEAQRLIQGAQLATHGITADEVVVNEAHDTSYLPPSPRCLKIDGLNEVTTEFLGIFSYVGDSLPIQFFDKAYSSVIWGPNGQPICPGNGVPEGYDRMLCTLMEKELIIPFPNGGPGTRLMIHPEVPGVLSRFNKVVRENWKYLATCAIFHAYPKDAQLSPIDYTTIGTSFIPNLQRALSYLHELKSFRFGRPTLELAIDACLSASNFGDKRWKTVTVEYAEHMASFLDCPEIKGRVCLRKTALTRLYASEAVSNLSTVQIPRTNHRSNADFGRLLLLQARLQIERREPTESIHETLREFHAFSPMSDLEKSVQLDINFLKAKIHRYGGEFELAKNILEGFMQQQAVRYRANNIIMIHYYETLCETGNPSHAMKGLEYEYEELLKKENGQSGGGRRLRLALGGAYLMKALWDRRDYLHLLDKAERLFHSIQWVAEPTKVTKHNFYVFKASLGMIHLLRSEWEKSMKYWDEALVAARDCFPQTGHAEMVLAYAQYEVLHRLGQDAQARIKWAEVQMISRTCDREYYFLGQGTAWLDKISELAMDGGRPALQKRAQTHRDISVSTL